MSKLRELREKNNLKSVDMAALIDCSEGTYSKKENNRLKVSLAEAKIISDFFGLSIEQIFFA